MSVSSTFVDVSKKSPIKEEVKEDLKCHYCRKQFKWKSFFIKHKCKQMRGLEVNKKENSKEEKSPKHECKEDVVKFISPGQLKLHLETPKLQGIQFTCDICESTFKYKHRYERHMNYHSDQSLTCKECKQMFTTKSKLITHNREIHLKEKFKCEFCQQEFILKGSFLSHKKLHLDIKYDCEECESQFTTRPNLERLDKDAFDIEKLRNSCKLNIFQNKTCVKDPSVVK